MFWSAFSATMGKIFAKFVLVVIVAVVVIAALILMFALAG